MIEWERREARPAEEERARRAPQPAPVFSLAWREATAEAIAGKRDLRLKLADEGAPAARLPASDRGAQGVSVLEALAHDSGDLRAVGFRPPGRTSERAVAVAGERAAPALRAARNDRCPCGSGRTYKACCLPEDLAGAARTVNARR